MFLHLLLEAFKNCSQLCRKISFLKKPVSVYARSLDLDEWERTGEDEGLAQENFLSFSKA